MSGTECFALLDDASAGAPDQARSRLYSGHTATLRCATPDEWPQLVARMESALAHGLYAVPLLTYELGAALQGVPWRRPDGPLAQILLFERCELLAPHEVTQWLAARAHQARTPAGVARVRANVDEAQFTSAIDRIRAYIEAGDTYQVNYTMRLRFEAFGSLFALYTRLRARQPVPYGALIGLPDGSAVLSLSPELFVQHRAGVLTARPMKGTASAADADSGDGDGENARRAAALAADTKNRAENLMIVDLLRNDLGRVCDTGTVTVPALFDVSRFSSVLQMTSTVQGRRRADAGIGELFAALYPCGSITGAPKRRTMEIIAELEPDARGIYTGGIGWFDPPSAPGTVGDFCLAVPIRTLALGAEHDGVRAGEMGVGAGIVHDSVAADEYAECQLKARFLTGMRNEFELFETMRMEAGACRHQELHLARLARSADYFGFAFDAAATRAALAQACASPDARAPARVRLAVRDDGSVTVQSAPLPPLVEPVRVLLAPEPTNSGDLFLRHKSSVRERYDAAWRRAEAHGAFDALFFNERGELTEGGRSSVFVKIDGRWYTPPLACGVLPGVLRAQLLEDPAWAATERVITRAMFAAATEVVICNALRGPLPVLRDWGRAAR